MEKLIVEEANAPAILDWMNTRSGIAIWESMNLSNLGKTWTTPVHGIDGRDVQKPSWEAADKPSRIITDKNEIVITVYKEVKRFHVAVRRGSQGFALKLTDASSRRVERAVAKAGKGAVYEFDYYFQDAVILVPDSQCSLVEWEERKKL